MFQPSGNFGLTEHFEQRYLLELLGLEYHDCSSTTGHSKYSRPTLPSVSAPEARMEYDLMSVPPGQTDRDDDVPHHY